MKLSSACAVVTLLVSSACSNPSATSSPPTPATERAPTAKEAVKAAALVIDVRSADEFAGGHLDRAENIPVDEVEARLGAIAEKVGSDKSKPIAVYCAAGGRAARAKQMLEKAGYTHVTNAGGYSDLKN